MQNSTGDRGYDEVLVSVRRGLGPVYRRFRAIIFFWCFTLGCGRFICCRRLLVRLTAVVCLVEAGPFKYDGPTCTNEPPQFAFFAFWARSFYGVHH